MDNTRTPVLYIVDNCDVDLVMGALTHWLVQGAKMMPEHSALWPGGSAGNCALAAAAIQLPRCAVGCRDDDAFAPWLATQFSDNSARWPQYPCETPLTAAITHPNKEHSFLSNHGHITRLTAGDVLSQLPAAAGEGDVVLSYDTLLCTGLLSDYPQLPVTLRQHGFTLAVDIGWSLQGWSDPPRHGVDRWLGDCNWLLLNDAEAPQLVGHLTLAETATALAARLSDRGEYVVKCGADGTDCRTTDGHHHVPTRLVAVIDTIGAGDSFNAGLPTALLNGKLAIAALHQRNTTAMQAIDTSPCRYPDWHTPQHHLGEAANG